MCRTTNPGGGGSSPPVRANNHKGVGEPGRPRLPWKQEIGGSNPLTLTNSRRPAGQSTDAWWRNGNAAVCKIAMSRFDPGPRIQSYSWSTIFSGSCSVLQWLEWTGARFLLGFMRVRILLGAPIACVAQRMSARILGGMTLVRLQPQAPMTTPTWRGNRRGLRRRLLSGRSVRR